MPRRPRVFIEGGIYHVFNRFARGAEVFGEGDEAERFLALLHKVRDRAMGGTGKGPRLVGS